MKFCKDFDIAPSKRDNVPLSEDIPDMASIGAEFDAENEVTLIKGITFETQKMDVDWQLSGWYVMGLTLSILLLLLLPPNRCLCFFGRVFEGLGGLG